MEEKKEINPNAKNRSKKGTKTSVKQISRRSKRERERLAKDFGECEEKNSPTTRFHKPEMF